jgi:hypothetical protein
MKAETIRPYGVPAYTRHPKCLGELGAILLAWEYTLVRICVPYQYTSGRRLIIR